MTSDRPLLVVAGASGFIGTNLILRLVADGYKVRGIYHSRRPHWLPKSVDLIEADLRDPQACRLAVEGADSVFMCAAVTSGAHMIKTTPLIHITPNVIMNAQMLEAAHAAKVRRFVFISSAAAYPSVGARPVREEEMFDADPYPAYYAAGWMKRYAEILCRTYAEKIADPMSTVVVRPSNIYGPYDKFDFKKSHVTAALIRRVAERQTPMEVWGTGNDIRDVIYIDDFIDGLMLAYATPDPFLAINICSGHGVSVRDILQTAIAADNFTDADVRFDPSKPSTIPVLLIDHTLAQSKLGFQSKISLADGIRRTLAWYKANPFAETA